MRKLVESTFVALDGVIQDPHIWGPPYWGDEHDDYVLKLLSSADELLLGRATYEGFAAAWPPRSGEIADRFNSMRKHVASRKLTEATWNATVIEGDVAEAVAKLKQAPGAGILKFGTGEVDRTLVEHDLVDEFHFWVYPVVVGEGQRLLDGLLETTHLKLLDATVMDNGIVVHVCGPK